MRSPLIQSNYAAQMHQPSKACKTKIPTRRVLWKHSQVIPCLKLIRVDQAYTRLERLFIQNTCSNPIVRKFKIKDNEISYLMKNFSPLKTTKAISVAQTNSAKLMLQLKIEYGPISSRLIGKM